MIITMLENIFNQLKEIMKVLKEIRDLLNGGNEQFDAYKDYYEFKTCWTGCDYTHHHYLRP